MPRYIAFLRAINVGGHTVKMDHLRKLFEALQFTNVSTFISSGNVIFDSAEPRGQKLEARIGLFLKQSLGYEVTTFIRSPSQVSAIARYKPFPISELETEDASLYIVFLPSTPNKDAQQNLMTLRTDMDDLRVNGREVYWLCRAERMTDSKMTGGLLTKTICMPLTIRNASTVKKIAAKYATAGSVR